MRAAPLKSYPAQGALQRPAARHRQRWRIEELHKCLKTGCRIECSQLKHAQTTQALLGFCSVVATRLLALSRVVKTHPQALAKEHIEDDYVQVLRSQQGLCAQKMTTWFVATA